MDNVVLDANYTKEIHLQVFTLIPLTEIVEMKGVRELLKGLISYSQRHYTRIDGFKRSTFLMDYILNGMLIIEPVMGAVDDPKNESLVDPIEVVVECLYAYGLTGADLTGKMTVALAATSILFKDDNSYHKKLLKLQYGFEGKECLEKCLEGSLSAHIGNINFLRKLSLINNSFHGTIPHEVGRLSRLSGSIPIEISLLLKLSVLAIEDNKLTGGIPPFLGNITSMKWFSAPGNPLGGSILDTLGLCKILTLFSSSKCNLYGSIPCSIFNLSLLVTLCLHDNHLTGSLPSEIGNQLPNLEELLQYNNFHGRKEADDMRFIDSLKNYTRLVKLELHSCNLTGVLPISIGNLSNQLSSLGLGDNQLFGSLLSSIVSLVGLNTLVLGANRFNGSIPTTIGKLQKLQVLALFSNQFSRPIPDVIGNLSLLIELYLYSNKLEGLIPSSLGNCKELIGLDLPYYVNPRRKPIPRHTTIFIQFIERTEELNALCTPESFVTHSNFDTPSGTVYYIPKVSTNVLLAKGIVYGSVEDCVVAYMKYAVQAWFIVRRSCQKRMLNGDVKQKYLVCNRMGCPKGIHVDTLDLRNSDKQKRNSNLHITGCKARAVFNLDTCTGKFVLHVFDTIHSHELEREEYKHLSKTERHLTYMEQEFIVKAASVNISAIRAHHLLTGIKGSYLLFHGTTIDFKNFFRSVNCYIGDSDAQMLIYKMENRKKHVSDCSFDYLVENAELTAIFWADDVSEYNYREFGDVVSFDATFKKNKYKMVFVPFTAIDNHMKCVTVVADEAMRNAIEAEFCGSKHRLCMWHITQKLPAKDASRSESENSFFSHFINSGSTLMNFMNCFETAMEKQRHVQERMDHKTIDIVPKVKTLLKIEHHVSNVYTRSLFELVQKEIFVGLFYCQIDLKCLVEGSKVCIIKESPYVYEMPNKKKKKPQYVDKGNDKAEENDKVDMFFKKDGLYKKQNMVEETIWLLKSANEEQPSIV
ncbi:protein FAR1-related sequence 5 [Tanacetum coccineum]|uniref:Protein FAR1-related sequence 5 n=1 Tax=Tanacetum coccineum TaxID=301880 RepID=A0ABQ5DR90_9ASTR